MKEKGYFARGFILTKWYVNISIAGLSTLGTVSFILTKWYVNYINRKGEFKYVISFILTKWYVNGLTLAIRSLSTFLFYIN
ncbi:Uncharacterised protein [Clostridioides difficile]|nr:Uncharacterised protein [Clostridioides difficile]SJU94949.1 Uncharacterised protein [Clostridioides difficile]SJU96462.1 Uncharacterised protein [Clostridioides difficile]SJV06075.1 Uncharacterised protein [Clostridioides difficile]VHO38382.1 Uncharacterised protein [Clostridioides difficile]